LASLVSATRDCGAVFHLAAVSNVNLAFKFPVYTVDLNALGTAKLLEAVRINKVDRLIFASTVWVYAGVREEGMLPEHTPFYLPDAGHIYTSSKIAAEMFIHNYHRLYGQKFTILRYGIPYGPRMREELVIAIFVKRALEGKPLTIQGAGDQYRNYIYISDLASANVLALSKEDAVNRVFNLEGPRPVTVREVAETIREILGSSVTIEYSEARPGDYKGKIASNEKATKLLGWAPRIDFREGMTRYIKWFLATQPVKVRAEPAGPM
jgi:UDP-glucose 4-epimerase